MLTYDLGFIHFENVCALNHESSPQKILYT